MSRTRYYTYGWMIRRAAVVLLFIPGPLTAQSEMVVQLRVESSSLANEFVEPRGGFGFAAGSHEPGGGWRLSLSHVPEGDVEPGWQTALIELGPRLFGTGVLDLDGRIMTGGHRMNVDNRHAVMARCAAEPLCMFEAPGFGRGWSWIGGGLLEATVRVVPALGLTVGASSGYLLMGANSGEWVRTLGLGASYRFQSPD